MTHAADPRAGFAEVFARADRVPGWLTRDQARVLHDAASAVPAGVGVVEIGSHLGRSAIVLAAGLLDGSRLTAVDPFPADWRYGRADTESAFRNNLAAAGVEHRVDLRVASSADVLAGWQQRVGLVYVDGKHDYWSVVADLGWHRHVVPGGLVLVHDAYSSLGVTLGLLRVLTTSGNLRYAGRTGSLVTLVVGRPRVADRLRSLTPVPWWVRNLVVKVLLRLRLRPAAALLGHTDPHDPY